MAAWRAARQPAVANASPTSPARQLPADTHRSSTHAARAPARRARSRVGGRAARLRGRASAAQRTHGPLTAVGGMAMHAAGAAVPCPHAAARHGACSHHPRPLPASALAAARPPRAPQRPAPRARWTRLPAAPRRAPLHSGWLGAGRALPQEPRPPRPRPPRAAPRHAARRMRGWSQSRRCRRQVPRGAAGPLRWSPAWQGSPGRAPPGRLRPRRSSRGAPPAPPSAAATPCRRRQTRPLRWGRPCGRAREAACRPTRAAARDASIVDCYAMTLCIMARGKHSERYGDTIGCESRADTSPLRSAELPTHRSRVFQ